MNPLNAPMTPQAIADRADWQKHYPGWVTTAQAGRPAVAQLTHAERLEHWGDAQFTAQLRADRLAEMGR